MALLCRGGITAGEKQLPTVTGMMDCYGADVLAGVYAVA